MSLVNYLLLSIFTITCAFPSNFKSDGTTLTCSNGLVPLFTNETFCTPMATQKIFTCCHGNENNIDKENSFKSELRNVLGREFAGMSAGLAAASGVVGGITCPQGNISNLLKTTETSLEKLGAVNWSDLFRDSNFECRIKVARATLCGSGECAPLPLLTTTPLPCHSLCINLLRGCYATLSGNLLSPWKYAINSIRSAVGLVLTTNCEQVAMETKFFENFLLNLNGGWREPFNYLDGICNLRAAHGDGECFNGAFGEEGLPLTSTYDRTTPTWSTNPEKYSNPEFKHGNSEFSLEYESKIQLVREELLGVAKHLEKFWPSDHTPLDHSPSHSSHSSHLQSDESFEYDDDEDDEYEDDFASGGSGFHDNQNFQTDDEDLLNPLAGSGDGEDTEVAMTTVATITDILIIEDKIVVTKSCCGSILFNYVLLILSILITIN